ncbi:MAG: hypothetical protein IKJ45_07415, partial [Kiritimatiellae bacterium]|nr:hypothetical protein [Kiritimatiellia bacterium]
MPIFRKTLAVLFAAAVGFAACARGETVTVEPTLITTREGLAAIANDLGGFYRDENNTFLKRYYKVHIIKGTITAVEHTSLFSANGGAGE